MEATLKAAAEEELLCERDESASVTLRSIARRVLTGEVNVATGTHAHLTRKVLHTVKTRDGEHRPLSAESSSALVPIPSGGSTTHPHPQVPMSLHQAADVAGASLSLRVSLETMAALLCEDPCHLRSASDRLSTHASFFSALPATVKKLRVFPPLAIVSGVAAKAQSEAKPRRFSVSVAQEAAKLEEDAAASPRYEAPTAASKGKALVAPQSTTAALDPAQLRFVPGMATPFLLRCAIPALREATNLTALILSHCDLTEAVVEDLCLFALRPQSGAPPPPPTVDGTSPARRRVASSKPATVQGGEAQPQRSAGTAAAAERIARPAKQQLSYSLPSSGEAQCPCPALVFIDLTHNPRVGPRAGKALVKAVPFLPSIVEIAAAHTAIPHTLREKLPGN